MASCWSGAKILQNRRQIALADADGKMVGRNGYKYCLQALLVPSKGIVPGPHPLPGVLEGGAV